MKRTLSGSPAVQIQHVEIDRREGVAQQTSGEFDWNTATTIARSKQRVPALDPLGRTVVTSGDSTDYSVAVTRRMRNGVVVQPSAQVSVPEPSSPVGPTIGTSQLNLQIIVPLLRGLGRDSADAAEAAARGDVEVARLLYRQALSAQALATVQAYWSARAAVAAVAVQKEDENRAEKLHQGIRDLVNARVFAPNLLLQSEANLRQKSTAANNAELDAENTRFALAKIMGLPPAEAADAPVPSDPLPEEVTVIDMQTPEARTHWIQRALGQRPDFLAARQSQVPLHLLTRQAEIDLKPRLDLSVTGGYAGIDRSHNLLSPLARNLTGANGSVGLQLDWPAENNFQRGLLRTRRAAERQVELSSAQLQSDIAADVCAALAEVRLRAQTMRDAAATAVIARKAVDQEQRKLQTGEATVLDVINLQNLHSSAQLSQIDAQAGYAIAVARLRYTVGAMFTAEQKDHSFQLSDLSQLPLDEK